VSERESVLVCVREGQCMCVVRERRE